MPGNIAVYSLASECYLRIYLPNSQRDIVVGPSDIKQMVISQAIDSLLPTFSLTLPSTDHQYIHLFPFDKQERITIELGYSPFDTSSVTSYEFITTQRISKILGDENVGCNGILDIVGLYDKIQTRAFKGTISDTIYKVISELKVGSSDTNFPRTPILVDVSSSLDYQKSLLQCNSNNATFLESLSRLVEGKAGEMGFLCYFYCKNNKVYFVFRSIEELLKAQVKHKLYFGMSTDTQASRETFEYHQVFAVEILDHLRQIEISYPVNPRYCYFDYDLGQYVYKECPIDDSLFSLTKTIALHKGVTDGIPAIHYGRSNEMAISKKGYFYQRNKRSQLASLLGLSKMKVLCAPLFKALPGDLVLLYFATPFDLDNKHNYQYQGIWLIQKVSHIVTNTLYTELILTRQGLEGNLNTLYTKTSNYKRL